MTNKNDLPDPRRSVEDAIRYVTILGKVAGVVADEIAKYALRATDQKLHGDLRRLHTILYDFSRGVSGTKQIISADARTETVTRH